MCYKENRERIHFRGRFDRIDDTVRSEHGRDSGVELKTISEVLHCFFSFFCSSVVEYCRADGNFVCEPLLQ